MFQSNSTYYIKSTISQSQGALSTFLLSTDSELGLNLETGGKVVSFVIKNNVQIERFLITATGGTATIILRGLTQESIEDAQVGLQKDWSDGSLGYITALAFNYLDKEGDTMVGPLKFSGNTNEGIVPNNLTTSYRLALTPDNGAIVYDTTIGSLFVYQGGNWYAIATNTGPSLPNATTTVAGIVQIATSAQTQAGTNVGSTGAKLEALPSDIAANEQSGTFVYAATTSAANTYTANLTPALTAYKTGMTFSINFTNPNSGACTLALNGLSAISMKTRLLNDPNSSDIYGICTFIYNGTYFVLQTPPSASTSERGVILVASDSDYTTGSDTGKAVNSKQARGLGTTIQITRNFNTSVDTQDTPITYTHGLGYIPTTIEMSFSGNGSSGHGIYNSTGQVSLTTVSGGSSSFESSTIISTIGSTGMYYSGIISSVTATTFVITWHFSQTGLTGTILALTNCIK